MYERHSKIISQLIKRKENNEILERADKWFEYFGDKDYFLREFFEITMLREIFSILCSIQDEKLIEALKRYMADQDPEELQAFEAYLEIEESEPEEIEEIFSKEDK